MVVLCIVASWVSGTHGWLAATGVGTLFFFTSQLQLYAALKPGLYMEEEG